MGHKHVHRDLTGSDLSEARNRKMQRHLKSENLRLNTALLDINGAIFFIILYTLKIIDLYQQIECVLRSAKNMLQP